MLFDSVITARVAGDIRRTLSGARVERVFSPDKDSVVLDMRRRTTYPQIVFSWSAEQGRVQLTDNQEPRADLRIAAADVIRRYLRGATLVGCQQVRFDRILKLEFANCENMGPEARMWLIAEVMGRHANLILVDSEGKIAGCACLITLDVNRYREIMPGLTYVPPPGAERIVPAELTVQQLDALTTQEPLAAIRDTLRANCMGSSELFLDEVLARADIEPEQVLSRVQIAGWETLLKAIKSILTEAEEAGKGYLYRTADGRKSGRIPAEFAYPLALQSHFDLQAQDFEDFSASLQQVAQSATLSKAVQQRRDRVTALVRRALKKIEGRIEERRKALLEAEDADALKRHGELILANLHAIKPGADKVEVIDWYDPEQATITLTVSPHYPPQDYAQALFARYKRARRIIERVPALLAEAETEAEYLHNVTEIAETSIEPSELDELEAELIKRGHVGEQALRKRKTTRITAREPRRIVLPEGFAGLYGTTGTQNDTLLRAANSDDIWFHVRRGPGGHVIIRNAGHTLEQIPDAVIEQAAALAAGLSHWKNDARTEVAYTFVRHVTKPPGAPPGFVIYSHFKTLDVQPQEPPKGN